jgi:hypothetical protein
VRRCWAHKIHNVLDKVRVADPPAVKADLRAVMNTKTPPHPRSALLTAGWPIIHGQSPAGGTISMNSSPAGATNPWPSANSSEPPMPP